MTRPQLIRSSPAPVRSRPRHFLLLLALPAISGLLAFQFAAGPEGGDQIDVAWLAAAEPVETALPEEARVGSAQAPAAEGPLSATPEGSSNTLLSGRTALLMNLLLIERGHARLKAVPEYTATFLKQERIGDELGEAQVIRMKLRHEPFSVYMKWYSCDKGRELIYVDGQNDGKMLVHVGGWKARLLPTVKVDPHGRRAMAESRHPVTEAGLLEVARRSIAYRERDLKAESGVRCRMLDNQTFDGRDCYCFIVEYDRPDLSDGYRKVVAHVDKEFYLPVAVKNYGWPKESEENSAAGLDEQTLIEVYSYSEIDLRPQLTEADFSRGNKEYGFR